MLKINFLPDSDRKDLLEKINRGLDDYKNVWDSDGRKIVKAIENTSGLKFKEKEINAIVFISTSLSSRSFPLSLRADLSLDFKQGLIIHELCHRLLSGNHIRIKIKEYKSLSLEIHKVLNLILYDVWVEIYGKKFADQMVRGESGSRRGIYKKAWKWALSFDKETRKKKFSRIVERVGVSEP